MFLVSGITEKVGGAAEASLEEQGMPPGFIRPYTEIVDASNSGWIDFGVPGTEPVAATVTPAQVFAQARKD